MRNRALHDALREFALEAASLLTDDQRAGAEVEFEVADEGGRRGPALYVYRPLTERFIAERWHRLRSLPTCGPAAAALGAGAASFLRATGGSHGVDGTGAEPALQAMLERLYEDATSFAFPEERFERVYLDVEGTLYRDSVPATVVAPLPGVRMDAARVDLGDGLSLVRCDAIEEAPPEAVWPKDACEPAVLCALDRDAAPDDPDPAIEAGERFRELVTGLRLFKAGGVTLGGTGWRRSAHGRWAAVELEGAGAARGEPWELPAGEEQELREFLDAACGPAPGGAVAWALGRFDMGCSRALDAESLSDYLLGLRALLGAPEDGGPTGLALRLAALCAEDGERRAVQRRVELALVLERFLMRGDRGAELQDRIGSESPRELVLEMESHLRALLRDVLCGYLDPRLERVADDILLEAEIPLAEPEIEVRDLRRPPVTASARRAAADTTEIEALELDRAGTADAPSPVDREPAQPPLEGVSPSSDWLDDSPESYSAPV